jgi:hypothetical protein
VRFIQRKKLNILEIDSNEMKNEGMKRKTNSIIEKM